MLCGWARQPVDVLTVEPAGVGCLQVQPIETIRVGSNVQSEVGGEQVSMLCDTAPTAVDPLRERLFLAVPAQAGLGQGRGHGVVLVETFPAGAFNSRRIISTSIRGARSRTLRGKFFPRAR